MIYLVYEQNSGGRSGHKLKDIITVFILNFLIKDSVVLYHNSYSNQFILDSESMEDECFEETDINYDAVIKIDTVREWLGITFQQFEDLNDAINKLKKGGKTNIKVVISNVFRIHSYMLHNWYFEKNINENLYETKLIPLLNKIYYKNSSINVLDQISIHIRRGDIAKIHINSGFDCEYYKKIVTIFNNHFNIPIKIYSEDYNNEDLFELSELKNTSLNFGKNGDIKDLKEHFDNLCRSKIFVMSSSCFSMWAAYLSKGNVLFEEDSIKHFDHIFYPSNFYPYSLESLNKIVQNLSETLN